MCHNINLTGTHYTCAEGQNKTQLQRSSSCCTATEEPGIILCWFSLGKTHYPTPTPPHPGLTKITCQGIVLNSTWGLLSDINMIYPLCSCFIILLSPITTVWIYIFNPPLRIVHIVNTDEMESVPIIIFASITYLRFHSKYCNKNTLI